MTRRYFGCTVPWLRCDRDNHAGCHRRVSEAIAELRRQWGVPFEVLVREAS